MQKLSALEIKEMFLAATNSPRRRYPKIIHESGDRLNKVFNFLKSDTYMQPHLHPSKEKIEKMTLVQGKFALLYFDDRGEVSDVMVMRKGGKEYVEVPSNTWHTYVMLTDNVLVYEEMLGVYNPATWKKLAKWAPSEKSTKNFNYLKELKQKAEKF